MLPSFFKSKPCRKSTWSVIIFKWVYRIGINETKEYQIEREV